MKDNILFILEDQSDQALERTHWPLRLTKLKKANIKFSSFYYLFKGFKILFLMQYCQLALQKSNFLVNSHAFHRLIRSNLETPALLIINPCWSLIAFHLFTLKIFFSALSQNRTTRREIIVFPSPLQKCSLSWCCSYCLL